MLLPDAATGSTQPIAVQSSSPRASSSAPRPPPAPSYLSSRSADVILSEVRPTRIKSEALRSVNVLLDELLWLILGCARSFATDRLRTGLLKVLPTVLGKDALLEAEVELRAYIERNPPASPIPTDESTIQKFPLQQAFELLRIKCEAYSSLGDQEENTEAEATLHARIVQIAGDTAPTLAAVAPAALYLTAILEHVCEHVLSNVGRVVARDSSRSTAHSQDLYVALCEDESIYSLFKTMKVQEQIEQQSKMARPRRSKSFSRNDLNAETLTPLDTPAVPNSRPSLDSAMSNGSNSNLNQSSRGSVEKGRNKVTFKNPSRVAGDNGNSNASDFKHRRSSSLLGDKKNSAVLSQDTAKTDTNADPVSPTTDDDGSMQDFDDLMRSGTTMKVSLTPDRLKTFEVFAKEKNQRANRPSLPTSTTVKDANPPPSSFPNGASHLLHKTSIPPRGRNQVESIAEAPEGEPVRSRSASITNPATTKLENPITPRSRSFTDARAPSVRLEVSTSPIHRQSDISDAVHTSKRNMPVPTVDSNTVTPTRPRRQPAHRRESVDLDDVMDGSEDEMPVAKKIPLTPKSAQALTSGTRDLMDFLSEGPPEPPSFVSTSSGAPSSEPRGAKQGRFRTIVSRLTGSSSHERLSPRYGDDSADTTHRSVTLGVNGTSATSRPQPNSLHSKRSVPNVSTVARPIPHPLTSPSQESNNSASGMRARQLSMTRKAVPAWDSARENLDVPVHPKLPSKQGEFTGSTKSLPRPSPPSPTQLSADANVEALSPARKRVPHDIDQPINGKAGMDMKPSSPVSPSDTHSMNGHTKAQQEVAIASSRAATKVDRHAVVQELTMSVPAYDDIRNLRRLMARATSVDECRILVDMFLARCGANPADHEQKPVPSTPPVSPIGIEVNDHHEASMVEVLLGDGGDYKSLPVHGPLVNIDPMRPSGSHTHLQVSELFEGCNPLPQTSSTPSLTPSLAIASVG